MSIKDLQRATADWAVTTFGIEGARNQTTRAERFVEEALELAQACDLTKHAAMELVHYVYGRPVGDRVQEVGGAMLTLSVLCSAFGIDLEHAAWTENDRCNTPEMIAKIRAKSAAKPKFSALPQDALIPGQRMSLKDGSWVRFLCVDPDDGACLYGQAMRYGAGGTDDSEHIIIIHFEHDDIAFKHAPQGPCPLAPLPHWQCSRPAGHEGPCAAHEITP